MIEQPATGSEQALQHREVALELPSQNRIWMRGSPRSISVRSGRSSSVTVLMVVSVCGFFHRLGRGLASAL
jgi:hypothetical protein